ncbi:MAG: PHP domain-containing protein, partial [Candidatus Omnitrophica bacterium]|nr:PHP domain-containing protein [Candidatus Omnitrophota bacterium]
GSKNFNIKIRQRAVKQGLKINEYGVFRGDKLVAGRTEKDIFKLLKLEYIEPELREDNGEIELAQKFSLPRLIETGDIKGDLHAHSTWSDGSNSIREMADAAEKKGYSYIAITDHSQSLKVARGLSVSDLRIKKKEIDTINKNLKGFTVLYGTEVDIGMNGEIDYPEEILREFDIVVGAVHSGFRQSREQMTKRMIRACENKFVHLIAHPTGRLWGSRDAYAFDFDEVLKAARDTNTHLEINSFPDRLDLNDLNCRKAREAGVKLAINTDAHSAVHLGMMSYGLMVARSGWLEARDVFNTLSLIELRKAIKSS